MADPVLNTAIKQRVRDVYADFISDVNPILMSDWLIQEKVIAIDQWQEIKNSEKTNRDRCRKLLNHLLNLSNPKTFLVVRDALVKQNHWLLPKIDENLCRPTRSQTEKFAKLEKSNRKLQSQIMELKDELEKAVTAINSMEEERCTRIVRERGLRNTMNSTKEEFERLKKDWVSFKEDWVAKEQKYIETITHLRENVETNKNELSLKRKESPPSDDENDPLEQINRAKIIPKNPGIPDSRQISFGAKQETDSKNSSQETDTSSDETISYDIEYSPGYDQLGDLSEENNYCDSDDLFQ